MTRGSLGAAAPLAAVAVGVFANGGYSPAPRVWFGCAAVAALAVMVAAGARPRVNDPVAQTLLALAALAALSALWTIGPVDRTLIWSLVTAGYAALVLCGTASNPRTVAIGLAVIAFAAGLQGLIAVVTHDYPYAERVAGTWRPGGPFEYAPALALLQVTALPVLIEGVRSKGNTRIAAGAGLIVAIAVLALSASRLGVAMAIVVAGLALAPRRRALTAGIVVVALVVGAVAFGSAAGRGLGAHSDLLHGRTGTWRAAVETWADRPIAGTGADAFLAGSVVHQRGETIVFAHSLPLELAAELGIAGFALALALYIFTIRAAWRARGSPAARLVAPGALVFLVASLVDWPWHLAGAGAVWALCVGAMRA